MPNVQDSAAEEGAQIARGKSGLSFIINQIPLSAITRTISGAAGNVVPGRKGARQHLRFFQHSGWGRRFFASEEKQMRRRKSVLAPQILYLH
jgi:hypothetical protein